MVVNIELSLDSTNSEFFLVLFLENYKIFANFAFLDLLEMNK